MRASITQFFTLANYKFPISTKLKWLLRTQLNGKILNKYHFSGIKSEVLEIWIDTQPDIERLKINPMSDKNKGKYLSFTFIFPYHQVMKEEKQWLLIFIDEFFKGVSQILIPYGVEQSDIDMLQTDIKAEVSENEEYIEKLSENMLLIKDIIKNVKAPSANKVKVV